MSRNFHFLFTRNVHESALFKAGSGKNTHGGETPANALLDSIKNVVIGECTFIIQFIVL